MMSVSKVNKMVVVAMLAAISFVLIFIDFPILPGFSFLKIDFADVPVLIGTVLFGPVWGMVTAGLAGLMDIILRDSNPAGALGAFANWLAALSYILPIYYAIKAVQGSTHKKEVGALIRGVLIGSVLMTVFMSVINLFILLPLYMKLASFQINVSTLNMVLYGVVPFNLLKGIIVGIAIGLVYFRLIPIIRRASN
ncbi:ECF transporter S component [Pediococcus pentosaceus]|uniref:ECF transporter S component n=2 Tax=Pediococcus pentosaceus TaxID=1255 RepID=UPI001E61E0E6|nr:ECF transporter S component [Pediococcus pentosaceus]